MCAKYITVRVSFKSLAMPQISVFSLKEIIVSGYCILVTSNYTVRYLNIPNTVLYSASQSIEISIPPDIEDEYSKVSF